MEDFEKEMRAMHEELNTLKEVIAAQVTTISSLADTITELKKIWLLIAANRMQAG